jgi:hypothetical protein
MVSGIPPVGVTKNERFLNSDTVLLVVRCIEMRGQQNINFIVSQHTFTISRAVKQSSIPIKKSVLLPVSYRLRDAGSPQTRGSTLCAILEVV